MPEENLRKIQGVLERITFQNEENGFTVARLKQHDTSDDLTTVVGHLSGISVGSSLSLSGWWVKDSRHGWQFKVDQYTLEKPNTLNGIERYLGSGLIKGVGPGFACRIVKEFGLSTLDVLENEPERLSEVPGLGKKRINQIKQAWQDQKNIHTIMVFLQGHGISATFAVKIFKTYGAESLKVLEDNPYRLAEDIWGIGFKSADRIALALGIPQQDVRRARAGLLFALTEAAGDGHCFLEQDALFSLCRGLLDPERELSGLDPVISQAVPQLVADKKIIIDEERIYLAPLFFSEQGTAGSLKTLSATSATFPPLDLDKALSWSAARMGVVFAPEQSKALKTALENRVTIITGGPGTGKSTILKALLLILSSKGVDIELAAPTGRAAKRLGEACGRGARTIHRMLEYDPSLRGFKRNNDNPLEADLIIVDEASMLDIVLANSLFKSICQGAALLLVGDVDQLPSVGPGNVLRDCIDSKMFPVVRLSRIYRQGKGSLISINAARINQGQFLELLPDYQGEKDFYFIKRDEAEDIEEQIRSLCTGRLQKKFGFDPMRDIQIITPMRKGIIGGDNLNKSLQLALNKNQPHRETSGGWRHFLKGDKVMQVRNNYDKELFNGDLGFITAKDEENQTIAIDFDGRQITYESSELTEIVLAYATTVHKSQGSEFKCIIMPIHTSHYPLLQRNLLYTAITRGKELVILVGSPKAVRIAIKNNRVIERNSRLKQRICA